MIDLAAAHDTVKAMLDNYGITDASYRVSADVWHYASSGPKVEFTAAAVIDRKSYGGYARPTMNDALAALSRALTEYVSGTTVHEPITDLRVTLPGEPEPCAPPPVNAFSLSHDPATTVGFGDDRPF